MENYDFSGWATRSNLRCADGRTIMPNAFAECDGSTVPLVWNHDHKGAENVLGHALLENKPDGVYAYCSFNETPMGSHTKELVKHGDITSLSIYANKLKESGGNVYHGMIREVSLVLAGANPGAYIDNVLEHSDEDEESAVIFTGMDIAVNYSDAIEHSDKKIQNEEVDEEPKEKKEKNDMAEEEFNNYILSNYDRRTEAGVLCAHWPCCSERKKW